MNSLGLSKIRKAIVAAIGAGTTAMVAAWPDGLTPTEWGGIAAATVTVFIATYWVPNGNKPYVIAPTPPEGQS